MRTIVVSALLAASACFVAIAGQPQISDSKPAPSVLGYLETRDKIITITAGPQATYTVRTKQGKLLAKNVTATQLRAQFPDLHRIVERAIAGGEDARLNLNESGWRIVSPPAR